MSKLTPVNDRLLVKLVEKEEMTKAGIYLPDSAKEEPQQGVVIAVGPGKMDDSGKRQPMSAKIGDTVLFAKYGGDEIKLEGVEYKIIGDSDVLGIITK